MVLIEQMKIYAFVNESSDIKNLYGFNLPCNLQSLECVKAMKVLLHPECSALQNFEGLMALTNLAAIDDAHRFDIYDSRMQKSLLVIQLASL